MKDFSTEVCRFSLYKENKAIYQNFEKRSACVFKIKIGLKTFLISSFILKTWILVGFWKNVLRFCRFYCQSLSF